MGSVLSNMKLNIEDYADIPIGIKRQIKTDKLLFGVAFIQKKKPSLLKRFIYFLVCKKAPSTYKRINPLEMQIQRTDAT
jgi:hypothetical protein